MTANEIRRSRPERTSREKYLRCEGTPKIPLPTYGATRRNITTSDQITGSHPLTAQSTLVIYS